MKTMKRVQTKEIYAAHQGHTIELGVYGPPKRPFSHVIECLDCFAVLAERESNPGLYRALRLVLAKAEGKGE